VDKADGFVHFSTAEQVAETAAAISPGEDGLILAAFEADDLGAALKWEPSRGGALFPHLYGPLRAADVLWHAPLPLRRTAPMSSRRSSRPCGNASAFRSCAAWTPSAPMRWPSRR
jgi:uncharacterized protein (DUF952 family)